MADVGEALRLRDAGGHDDAGGRDREPFRIYAKPLSIETDVLRRYREAGFEDVVVPFRALYAAGEAVSLERHLASLDELAARIMIPELGVSA